MALPDRFGQRPDQNVAQHLGLGPADVIHEAGEAKTALVRTDNRGSYSTRPSAKCSSKISSE